MSWQYTAPDANCNPTGMIMKSGKPPAWSTMHARLFKTAQSQLQQVPCPLNEVGLADIVCLTSHCVRKCCTISTNNKTYAMRVAALLEAGAQSRKKHNKTGSQGVHDAH
jgi:hypothetical protein